MTEKRRRNINIGFTSTSFRQIKSISSDFNGSILVEHTYLFCRAGIPSSMKKDIAKIKAKAGKRK